MSTVEIMTVWIRADGSAEIGLGHVMRCISIGEAVDPSRSTVEFVTAADPVTQAILPKLPFSPTVIASSDSLDWMTRVAPGDWVLFDGNHFSDREFRRASECGARVAVVDDTGQGEFRVDILISPDRISASEYQTKPGAALLLGAEFALVRREFRRVRRLRPNSDTDSRKPITSNNRGLRLAVVLGGTDAFRIGESVARTLADSGRNDQVVLICGPGSKSLGGANSYDGISMVHDPPDIAGVFDSMDLVISAAGNTAWELACMGMPTILIPLTEDQRNVASIVEVSGAGLVIEPEAMDTTKFVTYLNRMDDPEVRLGMSRMALGLVDGFGPLRIAEALLEEA